MKLFMNSFSQRSFNTLALRAYDLYRDMKRISKSILIDTECCLFFNNYESVLIDIECCLSLHFYESKLIDLECCLFLNNYESVLIYGIDIEWCLSLNNYLRIDTY